MSENHYPAAFVTYGWCRSAYTVVRSLAAHGVQVHVGDSSPFAMSRVSRHTASFTRLPNFFSEPEAYVKALLGALQRTGAKVLLPCFEDIEVVMRYRDRFPSDLQIALPAQSDWAIAEDKLDYLAPVAAAGCPVPKSYHVRSREHLKQLAEQIAFPALVKVRMGNGARGVEIIPEATELEDCFFRIVEEHELPVARWPILQEQLTGRKFKLDGVFDNGRCLATSVFEILRCKGSGKFGTSTYRRTVDHPDVTRYAIAALEALNWHGMFNTDWICDKEGVPHLIDINGRLSGAVAVPYEAGMDLPWIWYQVSIGASDIQAEGAQADIHVRWILGDAIALVEHLAAGKLGEALRIPIPRWGCRHDDFKLSDPLPFLAQSADYMSKFLRARGATKPMSKGMIR